MYATADDMAERYGVAQLALLADRDQDGVPDAEVLARAIEDAEAIVDLHVRGRYAVPLSPAPEAIVRIVCDLARRHLYGDATEVPDSVLSADKAARDLLKLVADGKIQLEAAAAPVTSPTGAGLEVETSGPEPFFTDESLRGF